MKRILLSILFGILFPILYVVIIGSLHALLFPHFDLISMQLFGQETMGMFLAPVAVPVWFYEYAKINYFFGLGIYFDTFWFRVIWMLGFNFSLYTILSYFLFWYLAKRKSVEQTDYQNPPLPPQF